MKNAIKPVAPGLEVVAFIDFDPGDSDVRQEDRLIVTVDGVPLEIPLVA